MVPRKALAQLIRMVGLPGVLLALAIAGAGCDSSEGTLEEMGEQADEAVEQADEAIEEAAEETEDAAEEIQESVQ